MRCTRGAIVDIIVDLRPESPTYLQSISVELNEENGRALYVPERFAHGYQTLVDGTETSYHVGEFYAPETEGGLAYDDPRLGLEWPLPVAVISEKDSQWQPLDEVEPELRRRMTCQAGASVIIVDTALRHARTQGRPIRVGMVGAGFMGQGLTNQIVNSVPGHAHGGHLEPASRARRPRVPLRGARADTGRRPGVARGRDPRRPAGASPTTRSCSAAASRSTSSAR